MSIQIESIGNPKIKYKDHSNVEFDDLSNYLNLAKKAISKFANSFYSGLAKKMLRDEDAISNIAYSLMLADWRYDENYQSERDQNKTQYSYRNQCAIWAIKSYITKSHKNHKKNKKNKTIFSLDYQASDDGITSYHYIADKKASLPEESAIDSEERTLIKEKAEQYLSSSLLTEKQKEYIRLYYYDNYTFEQIGTKYNLTREAVRQSIKKGIAKIRNNYEYNN